ncbi:MAG: hypothetical protein ACE5HB_09800, partial [Terriglobia bacterium]
MKVTPTEKAWALLLALTLAGGTFLQAGAQQQPPREQKQGPLKPKQSEEQAPYTLRVDVPVVNVDVTVVDKNGNVIPGLRREHFRVFQDGEEQAITAFAPSEAPLTTVLLVEVTRAVGYILFENLEGAFYFLRQLRKSDWVALVAYDMRPHIEAHFTQNRQDIV